jgi:hypothetical protein
MTDTPNLKTPSATTLLLREKAWEEFCAQPERMDALSRQLIVLELTIPSLYLGLLKYLLVKAPLLQPGPLLYSAFICWLLALVFSLYSVFPKRYQVDYAMPRKVANENDNGLSIESFFERSTRHKRLFTLLAMTAFCGGIICGFIDMLKG